MSIFSKKKPNDEDIIILKQTREQECGGTDATQDTKAPKTIRSKEMVYFEATSALGYAVDEEESMEPLHYVSAYAVPGGQGTFLFIAHEARYRERSSAWTYVKADVFPELTDLVNEYKLAKDNGYHSCTHGLPEDFGGEVIIRYASGEKISFSDNQSPILSLEAARKIVEVFQSAMAGEQVILPAVSTLSAIRFEEQREDGGYRKAVLTFLPDGTAVNKKTSCYEPPKVFESEKPVDAETVAAIQKNIEGSGMFAWAGFPERAYKSSSEKQMTFVFADGTEITVPEDREVPEPLSRAFFKIELEMTTKH